MAGLSYSAFGREVGLSQPRISQLVKAGTIPVNADGKIDLDVGLAALRRNTTSSAGRSTGPASSLPAAPASSDAPIGETGGGSYNDARRRDAMAVAALRELDLAQRTGQLVERVPVARACEDAGLTLGKELEAATNRLAPAVFGAESVAKARELIAAELTRVREVIADTLEAIATSRNATRQ